ncbi:DUF962 domain-containing protein [bacterium]|nr:DUF962 domain-containing protein [bacterium]
MANDFIKTWLYRHKYPVDIVLHIIGIPMTFAAGIIVIKGYYLYGILCFIFGYVFQYIGHVIEGSEMGELMIIQNIFKKKSDKDKKNNR